MITFDWTWMYGAGIGIVIADKESCEEQGIHWGFCIMLGIVMMIFEKPIEE